MTLLIGGTLAYLFVPAPWWIVIVAGLAAVEVFEILVWLRWRKRRSSTGIESMIGERGVLVSEDVGASHRARVRIRGTTYPAEVRDGAAGDPVIVEAVDGMTLVVRRA